MSPVKRQNTSQRQNTCKINVLSCHTRNSGIRKLHLFLSGFAKIYSELVITFSSIKHSFILSQVKVTSIAGVWFTKEILNDRGGRRS